MSDDLRRRVDELEATVRGLTQELVEANDRINHLETAMDMDMDMESSPSPGSAEPSSASTSAEDEAEDADLDDIIVA